MFVFQMHLKSCWFAEHLLVQTDTQFAEESAHRLSSLPSGSFCIGLHHLQPGLQSFFSSWHSVLIKLSIELLCSSKKIGNGVQGRKVGWDAAYKDSGAFWMKPKFAWILSSCLTEHVESRYYWFSILNDQWLGKEQRKGQEGKAKNHQSKLSLSVSHLFIDGTLVFWLVS